MSVLDDLREKARQKPMRIVLPEADDPRVLAAAVSLAKQKIAVPVLVGTARSFPSRTPSSWSSSRRVL